MNYNGFLFGIFALIMQVIIFILYIILTVYDPAIVASVTPGSPDDLTASYHTFQNINNMIFIGMALLLSYLRKASFSGFGLAFFMSCLCIQWTTLVKGWIQQTALFTVNPQIIPININSMINADMACLAILITLGSVLGTVSRLQVLLIVLVEVAFYSLNDVILSQYLFITDAGGAMSIHLFGAFFGLALSIALGKFKSVKNEETHESTYTSNIFALIGTLFLWMYWPSFNAARLPYVGLKHRAIVNTYYGLTSSVIAGYGFSSILSPNQKLTMIHIQRATLAGGVVLAAVAGMNIGVWGAILIGFFAGASNVVISTLVTPCLKKFNIRDVAEVLVLHGFQGIVGGIAAAVCASIAYVPDRYNIIESQILFGGNYAASGAVGAPRSLIHNGGYQMSAIAVSMGFAIVGGLFAGLLSHWSGRISQDKHFDDDVDWNTPSKVLGVQTIPQASIPVFINPNTPH